MPEVTPDQSLSPLRLFDSSGVAPYPDAAESDEFCLAFGRAIVEWQFIETGIYHIYMQAIRSTNTAGAAAVFHVPSGFRTRLDMTSAALKYCETSEELIEQWFAVAKKLGALSRDRNTLTHGCTMFDPNRPAGTRLFSITGINYSKVAKPLDDPEIGFDAVKLRDLATGLIEARAQLEEFAAKFHIAMTSQDGGVS